jgi:tRNA dimethylallyltransferase
MPSYAASVILIAGPTASGKSALALDLARARDGVIINADSMQVYDSLRILTARPSAEDERQAPHRLYGHVPPSVAYSVSRWLEDVAAVLEEARAAGRTAIVVGGTGLYFKALTEGLSPVPPVPAEVRLTWRARAREAPGLLHGMLRTRDPGMADRLAPGDLQRITRALEVIDATGRSLADWQRQGGAPLVVPGSCERILVTRPREELRARCDLRFDRMMAEGALDEVSALMQLGLSPELPALRALGVAALAAHLAGTIPLADAVARGKAETRQYVKRQETWARKHMQDWLPMPVSQ